MADKTTPADLGKQLTEKQDAEIRLAKFVKAVKYQEKKFNCTITPYHTFTGDFVSSGWLGQALKVVK